MDVTCDRCATRYEFDEALVSTKGTTVKCTNCGHQFKVYRPDGASQLDGWTIRCVDGREMHYNAMRKLQAAIANGAITREDVLIPQDGTEPRRLSRIEELQSFFSGEDEEHTIRRRIPVQDTAPGHRTSSYPPDPINPMSPSMVVTRVRGSGTGTDHPKRLLDRDGDPVPSRTGKTLRPPSGAGVGSPPPEQATWRRSHELAADEDALHGFDAGPTTPRREPPPRPVRSAPAGVPITSAPRTNGAAPISTGPTSDAMAVDSSEAIISSRRDALIDGLDEATNPRGVRHAGDAPSVVDDETMGDESVDVPPPRRAVPAARSIDDSEFPPDLPDDLRQMRDESISLPPMTPSPSAARPSILRRSAPYSDPRFSNLDSRKRPGLARWVVGIIAVGVLAVGAFALADRYAPAVDTTQANAKEDDRVETLLQQGEQRLSDGDVEGAKTEFIKASAISETDARVLRGLARIEVIRADMLWLHGRLLEDGSPHRTALEQQLAAAVKRARDAADAAVDRAPDDPLSVGLRIDILRLEGKRDDARQLVSKLDGAGPDGGRSLALLDLLETEPNYGSVIDRLRTAARSERKLSRAQALLVFALARAERKDDAKKELDGLKAQNPNHPMVAPLLAFIEGTEVPAAASASAKEPPTPAPVAVTQPKDHAEPFATAEPEHHEIEPFATAEPHAPPPQPEPTDDGDAPPPPPPPAPAPTIDTSDLPPDIQE